MKRSRKFGHDVRLMPPVYVKPYVTLGSFAVKIDIAYALEILPKPM